MQVAYQNDNVQVKKISDMQVEKISAMQSQLQKVSHDVKKIPVMENVVQNIVHEVKKIPQLELNLHKDGNDISKIAKLEFEVSKVARDMQNVHQQRKSTLDEREREDGACNGGIIYHEVAIPSFNPIPTTTSRIYHAKQP